MANPKQVALLRKSVLEWNTQEGSRFNAPDLRRADLRGADLSGAVLVGVDLTQSDLSGANLAWAHLTRANLAGANMEATNLGGSFLLRANLTGANLNRAKVPKTIFGSSVIGNLDLGSVSGLNDTIHGGPSTVGLDTILKSGGKIPDEFLRGCGVDPLIQKMLVGDGHSRSEAFTQWVSKGHNPLQRCFISYATEDKVFVNRLQKALNEANVDYWYAPEHGRWGEELRKQIDLEISLRDRVLLVCSEVSLTKDWVRHEIDEAVEHEKKRGTRVIFPIMIDDGLLQWKDPKAKRILDVLAADFRKATKGAAFEKQLPRLLKALGYES